MERNNKSGGGAGGGGGVGMSINNQKVLLANYTMSVEISILLPDLLYKQMAGGFGLKGQG